jgi:hypothetical protein
MASKIPLVSSNGDIERLQSADDLDTTAVTQLITDNSKKIATTEFMQNLLTGIITEIDFGVAPKFEQTFTIIDSNIVNTDYIKVELANLSPTSKDLDENEMDRFNFLATANNGSFSLVVQALEGRVYGNFKIRYWVIK